MQLEGNIMGYSKKGLVIVVVGVILAGGIFYAGAKYEKHKLSSLGLLKDGNAVQTEKTAPKTKKSAKSGTSSAAENADKTATDNTSSTPADNSSQSAGTNGDANASSKPAAPANNTDSTVPTSGNTEGNVDPNAVL